VVHQCDEASVLTGALENNKSGNATCKGGDENWSIGGRQTPAVLSRAQHLFRPALYSSTTKRQNLQRHCVTRHDKSCQAPLLHSGKLSPEAPLCFSRGAKWLLHVCLVLVLPAVGYAIIYLLSSIQ
jgi:hypothetical protein